MNAERDFASTDEEQTDLSGEGPVKGSEEESAPRQKEWKLLSFMGGLLAFVLIPLPLLFAILAAAYSEPLGVNRTSEVFMWAMIVSAWVCALILPLIMAVRVVYLVRYKEIMRSHEDWFANNVLLLILIFASWGFYAFGSFLFVEFLTTPGGFFGN